MRKKLLFITGMISLLILFTACGNDDQENTDKQDELLELAVEFNVPETAEVGEEVQLEAIVTYGDEKVVDASQMDFDICERGKEDESVTIEADNHEDGTYTITYTFEQDGIYEMYAHTTAHHLHTMPKKEITVGEGGEYDDHEHGFHTEGFDLHFMELDGVTTGEEVELVVHIMLHEEAYEGLDVRYEIIHDNGQDWEDATEDVLGEYMSTYTFDETGTYEIVIHVEDDADLHEHVTVEVDITE